MQEMQMLSNFYCRYKRKILSILWSTLSCDIIWREAETWTFARIYFSKWGNWKAKKFFDALPHRWYSPKPVFKNWHFISWNKPISLYPWITWNRDRFFDFQKNTNIIFKTPNITFISLNYSKSIILIIENLKF